MTIPSDDAAAVQPVSEALGGVETDPSLHGRNEIGPEVLVYEDAKGDGPTFLLVSGSVEAGYTIRHEDYSHVDYIVDTYWRLNPDQSRSLRAALGKEVMSDALEPTRKASPHFDRTMRDALAALSPPPQTEEEITYD